MKKTGKKKIKLYERIYYDLQTKITTGALKHGDRIPTEFELMAEYGVSRITAANAVKMLVENHLVSRSRKTGTFVGQAAASKKQIIIPLVLPYTQNTNYDLIYGAQQRGIELGVTVPFYHSMSDIAKENQILKDFNDNPPDGIIIYPCSQFANISLISSLYSKNIPIVFIDYEILGTDYPLVASNNAKAMFDLTKKLIESGYTKLGFYGVGEKLSTNRDRFNGFCMAHAFHKLTINENFLLSCETGGAAERRIVNNPYTLRTLLDAEERPEVICCLNDDTAFEALKVLKAKGLSVPKDIGITGFDNLPESEKTTPPLTTISQNFTEIGRTAVSVIHDILHGKKPAVKRIRVETKMIIRNSVVLK